MGILIVIPEARLRTPRHIRNNAMLTPTNDNINRLLKLALADPVGRRILRTDWRKFMVTHFALNPEQRRSIATYSGLPPDRVKAIQEAVANVVKYGGAIRVTGSNPMVLVIKPKGPHPLFSCTIATKSFYCHLE